MANKKGRPSKSAEQLKRLLPLGIFGISEAKKSGVPQETLNRLVREGMVLRLGQGFYRHALADIDPEVEDFIIACKKFGPESAIGGPTALFHFHLIDQPPGQIWVLVPPDKRSTSSMYRCIRTKTSLCHGIEDHGSYRISNLERSIVEAFAYATKVGLEVALKAARVAIKDRLTTPAKISRQARELNLESCIDKYWEVLILEEER